jgi:hypothetical protein
MRARLAGELEIRPLARSTGIGALEELGHGRRRVHLHKGAGLYLWRPSGRPHMMPRCYSAKGPNSSRDKSIDLLAVGVAAIPTITATALLPSRQAPTAKSWLLRFRCAVLLRCLLGLYTFRRAFSPAPMGMVRMVPWPPTLEERPGRTGSHARPSGRRAGRSMTCPTLAPRPDRRGKGPPAIRRNPR